VDLAENLTKARAKSFKEWLDKREKPQPMPDYGLDSLKLDSVLNYTTTSNAYGYIQPTRPSYPEGISRPVYSTKVVKVKAGSIGQVTTTLDGQELIIDETDPITKEDFTEADKGKTVDQVARERAQELAREILVQK
jgi:hypothetical protein